MSGKPAPGPHRSTRRPSLASPLPPSTTASVLAVLVCHDGEAWLPEALAALGDVSPRPRYRLAVDTGSTDGTAELLAAARSGGLIDGVLTLPADTGFGAAVHHAVDQAVERWGDPGRWLWLLHDDSAPEPGCLAALLSAAEASPSVALLGPLCLDWSDPRLVVEAGLSTDASGHRQTGLAASELDPSVIGGDLAQSTEVLAVSSAGALVRRDVWHALGGYDEALPMLRDDIDFGWRVNRADHLVLVVPAARIRHARAASRGRRPAEALAVPVRAADRAHGVRTYLVNSSAMPFVVGVPRLALLCLLRALGFALVSRTEAARAELHALGYLLSGRAGLRAGRSRRRAATGARVGVRGLLVGRWARLRGAVRGGLLDLVRRRVAADAAIGRLPERSASRVAPAPAGRPVGPQALPAGALHRRSGPGMAGLRSARSSPAFVVTRPAIGPAVPGPPVAGPGAGRPSPGPRGAGTIARAEPVPDLWVVEVGVGRLVRELLLSPAVVLPVTLLLVALLVHRSWLGLDLTGGRLAPLPGLREMWSAYVAEWHPVAGGTASPAPATLAVVGLLGLVCYPFGGPAAGMSLLLIGSIPLAGVSAYLASRRLGVPRWGRALAAAVYALLPVGIQATVQGRIDGVIAYVLLPIVLSGVVGVLSGRSVGRGGARSWLPSACGTALGLAVVSAFAPLLHLIVLAVVLVGFVVVPGLAGRGLRRMVALFVVVMLPLGLLLPWPAVVLQHPEVLLHGTGLAVPETIVPLPRLVGLDAGGAGPAGWLGALVTAGALLLVVVRPRREALPGLAVAVIGLVAAVVVNTVTASPLPGGEARPGWPGPALLVTACGLLWAALGALSIGPTRAGPSTQPHAAASTQPHAAALTRERAAGGAAVRLAAPVLAGLVAATLAGGALLTSGALVTERPRLAAPIQAEVSADGTIVLVIGASGDPVRYAVARLPAFGDDDLAPVQTVPARAARWVAAFGSGQPTTTRSAVLEAAVSGVEFVVLPDQVAADTLTRSAGDLVTGAPPASDGRPVVRLLPLPAPVVVLPVQLADKARTGGAPPDDYADLGVVQVDARPPKVGAVVGPGAQGRVLVVAAESEPGWLVTVNGQRTDPARAWGHLVAVVVGDEASQVRVERSDTVRTLLLLTQLAVALFTAITAVPTTRP